MLETTSSDGLRFMKMHGAGNDFVIIDSQGRDSVVSRDLARALGDRHRGVGFDQLAEIRTGTDADIQLGFWNADGSTAEACGNATRCVAQHLMNRTGAQKLSIRTPRGILLATRDTDGQVWVNMGEPLLGWDTIPLARDIDTKILPLPGDPTAVGMGNPHCVFFVDAIDTVDVATLGARFEHDPLYPNSTNVEFAEVRSRDAIRMRIWERGVGITLASGSGACATAVAAHRRGLTNRRVSIELDGGLLQVDWRDDGVWLNGPTAHVFTATLGPGFPGARK